MSEQPKPTGTIHEVNHEWTADWLCEQDGMSALTQEQATLISKAHNAAISAEREKLKPLLQQLDDGDLECSQLREQLLGSKHCLTPENELGDSSGDVSGWDLIPVVKSNGELWLGLATIRHRNRQIATLNEQEAKGLLAAINAALAAERETVKNLRIEAQQYKREIERLKDMITDYANDRPR